MNPIDPTKTQVDAALAAAQRRYANDPHRAEMIARARRFKSSWIELAEGLTECRAHERYKGWNYSTFEEYYRRELHLRPNTVDKLMGSYGFLRKSAPEVLDRDGVEHNIPSVETIDFLRRAEEAAANGQASQDTVAEVRKAVVDDNLPLAKVTRLFKETLFPTEPGADQQKRVKEAHRAAKKLQELLGDLREVISDSVADKVESAIAALLKALPKVEEEKKGEAEHVEVAA